jgi:hypothetical protein
LNINIQVQIDSDKGFGDRAGSSSKELNLTQPYRSSQISGGSVDRSDDCKHRVEFVAVNGCGGRWITEAFDIGYHSRDRHNPAKQRGEFYLSRSDDGAGNSGVIVLNEIVRLMDLLDPLPNGDLPPIHFINNAPPASRSATMIEYAMWRVLCMFRMCLVRGPPPSWRSCTIA